MSVTLIKILSDLKDQIEAWQSKEIAFEDEFLAVIEKLSAGLSAEVAKIKTERETKK